MPYLYSAVHEGHETGLPIIRSLWLHHADDPAAVARGDEYLWGRDLLVVPVTEKGAKSRKAYLPRGTWYDFWTEEKLEGGREIVRPVDLATIPLFTRAGAIIPMGPVKQYTDEPVEGPTTLCLYPGADGAFTLYDDDGITSGYRNGDWMGIEMAWDDARRRLTLRLADGSRLRPPLARDFEVRLVPDKATRAVRFSGEPVEVRF
jgi:alpha-glucosidase (family GH31 glycosyl hydrolase)